jgi:hypothetical protein
MVAGIALGAGAQATAAMPGLYFHGFYMDSALAYSTADVTQASMETSRAEIWGEYGWNIADLQESSFDRTDIGYSFGVGFQLTDYLAGELAYVQMGEVRYTGIGIVEDELSGSTALSRTDMRMRARGLSLSGIAIYPMGDRWAFDARAGALLGKAKLSYVVQLQAAGYDEDSLKGDSVALTYGAGVNFSMSPGTAIRAGYTRLHQALYGGRDVSSWTLSLKYAW